MKYNIVSLFFLATVTVSLAAEENEINVLAQLLSLVNSNRVNGRQEIVDAAIQKTHANEEVKAQINTGFVIGNLLGNGLLSASGQGGFKCPPGESAYLVGENLVCLSRDTAKAQKISPFIIGLLASNWFGNSRGANAQSVLDDELEGELLKELNDAVIPEDILKKIRMYSDESAKSQKIGLKPGSTLIGQSQSDTAKTQNGIVPLLLGRALLYSTSRSDTAKAQKGIVTPFLAGSLATKQGGPPPGSDALALLSRLLSESRSKQTAKEESKGWFGSAKVLKGKGAVVAESKGKFNEAELMKELENALNKIE